MRALVYRGAGSLVLEKRPRPEPGDGEVLVRVDACSICGTDLKIAAGTHRAYLGGAGRVPGHEVAGTVAEVGTGAHVSAGERVFVAPNYGCGTCSACQRGQVNLCENGPRAIGMTDDGGFAEYLLVPRPMVAQGNLLCIGGDVDHGAIALVEPLACALRGSRACRIGEGDIVLVYGAGPVGLLHVALARLAGAAAVIVCEPSSKRRERALAWGASSAHDDNVAELKEALRDVSAPSGADAIVVAAPAATAQAEALELARAGGRVNLFAGLPRGRSRVELDTNLIHYKELVVTGTTASTNDNCRSALDLVIKGRVDTGALIEARLGLDSAAEAFELARSGRALKVVIEP
ncbi:MAG: alcohol dehydrogenase catalytic domain-containing protein [Actinobacteria bacterium]|nr:alcohol dehydrogenase catalytic domain-containing protein [Actinomycetota bacterium]